MTHAQVYSSPLISIDPRSRLPPSAARCVTTLTSSGPAPQSGLHVSCPPYLPRSAFSLTRTRVQFAELSNLHTHLTLRSLRPQGTRKRGVPFGYGFNLVACPNYTFEILAWISICVMTGSYAGAFLSIPRTPVNPVFPPSYTYADPCLASFFPSVAVHGRGCIPNGIVGEKETRQLQEGFWKPIPRRQKDPRPVPLLIALPSPPPEIDSVWNPPAECRCDTV